MAIQMVESFKYGLASVNQRLTVVNATSGTTTWSRVANRDDGYALRCSNSTTTDTAAQASSIKFPLYNNNLNVSLAIKHQATAPANAYNINGVMLGDGSGTHYGVNMCTGFGASSAGVPSGAAGITVINGTVITVGWHWWQIVGILNVGSGGYFRVYRDSVLLTEAVGDTAATLLNATEARLYLGNGAAASGLDIADLIVRDDVTLMPDSRVDSLTITSTSAGAWVGSDGDSVNNHLLLDDPGPTVDTSDYVRSQTVGATDTYVVSDLPVSPPTIRAVGVNIVGGKTAGGFRTVAPMVNTTEGTARDVGLSGVNATYWETNPVGGAAWTKADVDAMTVGMRVKT